MVAIYPRQSIFKKDSLSIEQQVERCVKLCESNGWTYKIYDKDKGYSGKDLKRPSFIEMMDDVRSGKIDKILCYKLDRISRNISDFSSLLSELQKYHCEFISISENFDTSSPIGRAMIYICMVFAQMERESISQRVHDNYYYRTELGFWGGGTAPYGYKLSRIKYKGKMHTVLEIDEEQAKVVKDIYKWYLSPNGRAVYILEKLNLELHIPSKQGTEWTSRVLMDVLSRPLYAPNDMNMYNYLTGCGAIISNPVEDFDGKASVDVYGKRDSSSSRHKRCRAMEDMYCNVSSHDAIIDSETWILVQEKRKSMLRLPSRSGTGKNSYFTGLMKCGCCGRGVSYTSSKGTPGYYICSSRKNKGWNSCDMKPAPKKKTDPAIIEHIIDHYSNDTVIANIRSAITPRKTVDPSYEARKNSIMIELSKVSDEIENLLSSLQDANPILIKYVNEKIVELDKKKSDLSASLSECDTDAADSKTQSNILKEINDTLDTLPDILRNGSFEEIRDLCHILVKKIVFGKTGEIEIEYTI